ncbi:hypothetical protein DPSP01_007003 [Paraphaeosphaeria sporulosa]
MLSRPRTTLPSRPIPIRGSSSRSLRSILSGRPTPESYLESYVPTSCTSNHLLRSLLLSKLDGIKYPAAHAASMSSLESDHNTDDEWSEEGDERDCLVFSAPPASLQEQADAKTTSNDDIKVRYAYIQQRDINVWTVSCPIVGHGKMHIVSRQFGSVQQVYGCCGKGPLVRRVRRLACRVNVCVYYVITKGDGRKDMMGEEELQSEWEDKEMQCGTNCDEDENGDWEVLKQEEERSEEQRTETSSPPRSTKETGLLDPPVDTTPTITTMAHSYRYARGKRIDSLAGEGYWQGGLGEAAWNDFVLMVKGTDGL